MHKSLSTLAFCLLSTGALAQSAAAGGDPLRGAVPAAVIFAFPPSLAPAAPTSPARAAWRAGPRLAENTAAKPTSPQSAGGRAQAAPGQTAAAPKNPGNDRYSECVKLWDAGTHMSKRDWSRTCRRIERRLESLQVENLDVDRTTPRLRKKGRSPDAG